MIRTLILKKVNGLEKELGASMDYVRHIVRTSLPAFFKFARLAPFAAYRKRLPAEPYHIACVIAARERDCGSCVQIAINQAKNAGVSTDVLQAAVDRKADRLSPESADVYRFSEAVVTASGDEDGPRRIRFSPALCGRFGGSCE